MLEKIPPKKFHQWMDAEIAAADAFIARLRDPSPENIEADRTATIALHPFLVLFDSSRWVWEDWQTQERRETIRRMAERVGAVKLELGL